VRTLAITQNITVDGSIEMFGDWFDPQGQADVELGSARRVTPPGQGGGRVLAGRRTFEDLRGYWPEQSDDSPQAAERSALTD